MTLDDFAASLGMVVETRTEEGVAVLRSKRDPQLSGALVWRDTDSPAHLATRMRNFERTLAEYTARG